MRSCLVLLIFQLILCSFVSVAQDHPFTCGADEHSKKVWNANPVLKARHLQTESQILTRQLEKRPARIAGTDPYIIPVVVHIIHQNGAENISDTQVLEGIQHLNDAFNNAGPFNSTRGTETGIQFCLAKQDEHGAASTGITRTVSTLTNMLSPSQDLALKNLIRWDPSNYLNIWLVNEITSESAGAGVAGYAYFPSSHGSAVDGVVNEARYFGSSPDNSKVHIHELGHYLGLYHTFEGACTNNDCLRDGDRVCDTPPDASVAQALCNIPINTCSTDSDDASPQNPFRAVPLGGLGDQPDMIINYMDYGLDVCRTIFTEGQKERMVSALTLIRSSLLESKGCQDLCPSPILLSFTPPDTSVAMGATVQFQNTTTGATGYQWRVNGVLFSSAQNPSRLFTQQGKYSVTLIASNGNTVCTVRDSIVVEVRCNVEASFTGPQKVKPTESITFTNTTTGAVSYQWLLDGVPVSTAQHYSSIFPLPGGFVVSLVAYNGTCYDTVSKLVEVNSCNPGNYGDNWYFGTWASIKFADGKATGSMLPVNSNTMFMIAQEGCIAMSDASGNFMFYANPNYAFNKNFVLMPNGSGLLGHSSATQMGAVQNPSNPNRFYLFTLDAFGGPEGLRYSEIDMTLDGGLGDILPATKNTLLANSVTEKITTVKHANGTDTWVIVHGYNTNEFLTYLVSSAGVSTVPVVSATGSIHVQDTYNQNVIGQLKASPDGCKLALAISGMGIVELFDFNNATGVVSNPVTFTSTDYDRAYGVEFSPNGSKLYVAVEFSRTIYQFDLNAGSAADIVASRYLVSVVGASSYLGSLQIGPYGKIYVARNDASGYVAAINSPNNSGAGCNFEGTAIHLGGTTSGSSLPSFSQSYFYDPTPSISGPDSVCANSQNISYKISGSTCSAHTNIYTLRGHGTIAASNATEVQINFGQPGIDTLIVERTSACGKTFDTLTIVVKGARPPMVKELLLCNGSVVLDAGPNHLGYRWQDNSTQRTFTASSVGNYWVELSTTAGCVLTDTFHVLPVVTPFVSLGPDTTLCSGSLVVLDAGSFETYEWQDKSAERTYSVFLPGKYWVTVTDQCGAHTSDTILINHFASPTVSIGSDVELCPGETIVLDAGPGFKNYIWQDYSTNQTFAASSEGDYSVMVLSENGCIRVGALSISKSKNCCEGALIPNLITLNGDGLNDTFILPCKGQGWKLEVYNRWGDLVYGNPEYENEWPATSVADGVYYFLVKKENKSYKGWVEVVH